MSHSSLYLTNLYNDLITNTPQTITMDIPSEVGQGRISQTMMAQNISATKKTVTSHSKALKSQFPTFRNSLLITLTDRKLQSMKRSS